MPHKFFEKFTIYKFNELDSTNIFATQQLKLNKAAHGDVIIAGFQTKGKGQADNHWFSSKNKNALFTIICKDLNIEISSIFIFNIIVSLALYETFNIYLKNENIKIKWPNDILINNKKTAGILIESSISGNSVKNILIGVGININEDRFQLNLPNATSFFTLSSKKYETDEVIFTFLDILNNKLSYFNFSSNFNYKAEYLSKLYGINNKRYFRSNGNVFEGTIVDVNSNGQLLVDIDGKIKEFNNKEIDFENSSY